MDMYLASLLKGQPGPLRNMYWMIKAMREKMESRQEKMLTFKIKSRRIARDINVSTKSGRKVKKVVYEKQVVFWSQKYETKARAERGELLKKAIELVKNPSKYDRATSYGAARYVKDIRFDKKTGEILKGAKKPSLDLDKLAEDEKYDGYYSIVTSELDMTDGDIIDTYRGLWEIEETI